MAEMHYTVITTLRWSPPLDDIIVNLITVAITRAKTYLDLSYLERRNENERFASPYLSEIQSKAKLASKKISDKDFIK